MSTPIHVSISDRSDGIHRVAVTDSSGHTGHTANTEHIDHVNANDNGISTGKDTVSDAAAVIDDGNNRGIVNSNVNAKGTIIAAPASSPTTPPTHTPPKKNFVADFLMGGVAATISKTAAAPLERTKLLLQNQQEMLLSGRLSTPYKGIADCFRRVVATEGVLGLWRSNGTNVLRYFPTQALNFAFKDYYKTLAPKLGLGKSTTGDGGKGEHARIFAGNVLSGAAAGVSGSVFVYSLDYARTRLGSDVKSGPTGSGRQFNSLADVYRQTLATDGVRGLYRGFFVSSLGIVVYRGLYFGLYDTLKLSLPESAKNNFLAQFALGWGVTNVASFVAYPLDTVRRRMMMTSAGDGGKYKGWIDCFGQIVKKDGAKALFNGAGANVLRAVASAGALAGYDQLQLVVGRASSKSG